MKKTAIRIESSEIRFRYAKGIQEPAEREFHTHHELFFLLNGEIEFISENQKERLAPNTLVIIPKGTFHQFLPCCNDSDYERCVFKLDTIWDLMDIIEAKFQKITLVNNAEINETFIKLKNLALSQRDSIEKNILLKAYLAEILVYINKTSEIRPETVYFLSPITSEVLSYVNQNISKDLSLEILSKQFHTSISHLAHMFKRDMHISLHKYILNKRLTHANLKIRLHIPATQAAVECGFNDYSNFYQKYKDYFGYAPSHTVLSQKNAD